MLIKSDLEAPTVVLQAALSWRPPRPPHITTISQEKWEVSYAVFGVETKIYIFTVLGKKVSLTIQGGSSIIVFSNESTLCMRWPKYWSFSFSISPSKEHTGLIFRMDWLDLLAVQGV